MNWAPSLSLRKALRSKGAEFPRGEEVTHSAKLGWKSLMCVAFVPQTYLTNTRTSIIVFVALLSFVFFLQPACRQRPSGKDWTNY